MAIVRAAAAAGVTWDSVEDVVAEDHLTKGADGISGTADDLIPAILPLRPLNGGDRVRPKSAIKKHIIE